MKPTAQPGAVISLQRLETILWIMAVALWMPQDWHLLIPLVGLVNQAISLLLETPR